MIANINGMWEYFEFLYTDEGIFTADVARHVFARHQFVGFGDGLAPDDPWGFYDWPAWWEFLKGPKYSLLFFWDSPSFFWAHLVAFWVAGVCLMIGFRTRLAAVLTWFLMNSILQRNHLAWEGDRAGLPLLSRLPRVRPQRTRVQRRQLAALPEAAQAGQAVGA